jgi:hypothetical protein
MYRLYFRSAYNLLKLSHSRSLPSNLVLVIVIATISNDFTLSLWNIRDRRPFWSASICGDDPPSITFVDGGVVIGRKQGAIFQLLPTKSNTVLSAIKFVHGFADDPDMFGHADYDSRIQTLWVVGRYQPPRHLRRVWGMTLDLTSSKSWNLPDPSRPSTLSS